MADNIMDLAVKKQEEERLTSQQILEKYGDCVPYERLRLENEVRFFQKQASESLIEIGKRLIILEDQEKGHFEQVLENVNMSRRSAYYAMTAARKFGHVQTFAHAGESKQIALTVLDDDEVRDLADGKKVLGMTMDDIDRMTVRELKKNIREGRKQLEEAQRKHDEKTKSLEAIIKEKSSKLDILEYEARNGEPLTKEKIATKALQKYRDPIIDNILEATERITRATTAIDEAQKIPHVPFDELEKLIEPWKGSFVAFINAAEDFSDAFNNIHVDKGGE